MDKSKCLKCGEGEASYCEKCYQDLIGENARLQYHLTKTIPTEENEVRLQNIVEHFEKIKHSQSTVEINQDDIKAIKELIAVKEHLKHKYESYYKLYWEESIPLSVIQNKIDEIQEQYEETLKTADFKEIETMNKTNFRGIILEGQRTILKELIEERKNKYDEKES